MVYILQTDFTDHLILLFMKSFFHGGYLSSNVTSLFGVKFENIFTENRYLFTNTFVIEHCFPINRLNEFFNIFNICSIVVPNQVLIWRWIFNTEIKFDDGSLNVMKDGHHYQLLNLVGQWILNQFRRKFVVVNEWV